MKKNYVKKILCHGLALAMVCSLFGAAPVGVGATEVRAADAAAFSPTTEIRDKMVQSSLYSTGNNARIKKVIERARAGETVSLAYIGGSITEGALASPNSNCYAETSATAFGKKYGTDGGSNVHFINAGMSGTPSDIGVIRYERDVIGRLPEGQDYPDILFIEFAVNDFNRATGGGAYEGLIRRALKSGSAVVLIFSVFHNKNIVCEPEYRPYGAHYDLPMVSMGDAINDYYQEAGFEEWYYGGDGMHPNNDGHKLMADCVINLFDKLDAEDPEEDNITDVDSMATYYKNTGNYDDIRMIDQTYKEGSDQAVLSVEAGGFNQKDGATGNFQYAYNGKSNAAWFPDNWMHSSGSGNDSFKVSLYCRTIMLLYKISGSTQFGKADVYIDGKKKTTLNCYESGGWNCGKVSLVLTEQTAAVHTLELKMAEGNESKKFTVLAVGYKAGEGVPPAVTPSPSPSPSPSVTPSASPVPAVTPSPAPSPTGQQGSVTNSPKPPASPQPTVAAETTVKKPGKPAIKKLKNQKKNKVVLTLSKKVSGAAGYQVAYAKKASMKGQKKKSFKGLRVTVKGLKKKKTYYFRVRAYVKKDGKKVYGNWSQKKRIKVKK